VRGQLRILQFNEAKRRPGRLDAERVCFVDVAARYLVAYKTRRDGTPRPKSSLAKDRTVLNVYLIPVLGNAWIGDLDLPDLNDTIRELTLQDGSPESVPDLALLWWGYVDLNHGPLPYQGSALTG
jgi:hypothetical protein